MFLKKWNPAYRYINIRTDNLNLLPVNDSLYDILREVQNNNTNHHDNDNDNIIHHDNRLNENINYNDNDDNDDDDDGLVGGLIENELDDAILQTGLALEISAIDVANAIIHELIPHPLANGIVSSNGLN